MSHNRFRIQLTGDVELRTGIGGESVNSYVPKDSSGLPFIPGSHIKGLMRASLKEIAEVRRDWKNFFTATENEKEWPYPLLDKVFGSSDVEAPSYFPRVRVEKAGLIGDRDARETPSTQFVSRTQLDEKRLAKETSLRTTEAIFAGSEFVGDLFCSFSESSIEGIAWRLGLLAIPAIGGARSRNGQCVVSLIDSEGREQPSSIESLLHGLDSAIRNRVQTAEATSVTTPSTSTTSLSTSTSLIELIYVAATPVCFPERPEQQNLITSGFSIPASAVQGSILHLLNEQDQALANSLFASAQFRCWPLHPCSDENAESLSQQSTLGLEECFDKFPRSVRISLSHRAAKFSVGEIHRSHFFDAAFGPRSEAYSWLNPPHGIPMKASDGVLLFGPQRSAPRCLWRSAMMARDLTTHGVIDGALQSTDTRSKKQTRRNLFSVEAMMPMSWRGMIVVPSDVAQQIADRINACTEFRIGKGRSVRGRGRMVAQVINDQLEMEDYLQPLDSSLDRTAIVLQSPVAIPKHLHQELAQGLISAEMVLRSIAADWLEHHKLPSLDSAPSTWASAGIRFGWNRHSDSGPLQGAVPVLLPGSIFTLTECASKQALANAICKGFYAGPQLADQTLRRGFGCVAVHPGQAEVSFEGKGSQRRRNSGALAVAMKVVYDLRSVSHLPRPSQIRAVEQRIQLSKTPGRPGSTVDALQYLNDQCERIPEVWQAWEASIALVEQLLKDFTPEVAQQSLKAIADMAVAQYQERESK